MNLFHIQDRLVLKILLALACICCLPSVGLAANSILNIRHWTAPDHTRVVIDTREKARYQVLREGEVLSLYFQNCGIQQSIPNSILLKKRGIKKILHEPVNGRKYKIDFFLDENVETNIFTLKKVEDKPYRIVIDIEFPDVEKKETEERTQAREQQRDRIIVIDPGHGGDDPGAVGKGGTYEKNVVLEIGRKLRFFLNQQPGYRAFLTRDGDYYVPFKKRLQIAREYGAAMFISVHADAAANREARGSSVYCLSLGGASSAAARILANKENLADLVGGSPNGESSEASDPIILNMCQTNTLNVSKNFGTVLLDSLGSVGHVKFRTVQEAQLRVLKLPEIPSVLVETAYISNQEEEELLKDSAFQKRIAEAIGKTVFEFSSSAPLAPSGSPVILVNRGSDPDAAGKNRFSTTSATRKTANLRAKNNIQPVITFHKVKKGETLQKIALRYNVPLDDLAQLNEIKKQSHIPAGKRLKIARLSDLEAPQTGKKSVKEDRIARRLTEKEEIVVSNHKVQKGETLDIIARRYHTTIAALLKLNDMQMDDSLYAGTTIKVNGEAKGESIASDANGRKTGKDVRNRKTSQPAPTVIYEVKKGDSLDSIARKYDTTVAELMKLNSIKRRDPLLAGKKIKIAEALPAAEPREEKALSSAAEGIASKKKKGNLITYKVKRGDTLDTIARRYKTSVSVLLSLNKMKSTDPLYANQPLKLPRDSSIF